jgi:hypothetical protein
VIWFVVIEHAVALAAIAATVTIVKIRGGRLPLVERKPPDRDRQG